MTSGEQIITGQVLDRINEGKVGIFPAKNGYMLVGSGTQEHYEKTSARIREIKQKNVSKPLARVVTQATLLDVVERGEPKSLTLVEKTLHVPVIWLVESGQYPELCHDSRKLGVTVARNEWETAVVEELDIPLIASSANTTGNPTPCDVARIDPRVRELANFIVDIGPLPERPDLAVVRLPDFEVFRESPFLPDIITT